MQLFCLALDRYIAFGIDSNFIHNPSHLDVWPIRLFLWTLFLLLELSFSSFLLFFWVCVNFLQMFLLLFILLSIKLLKRCKLETKKRKEKEVNKRTSKARVFFQITGIRLVLRHTKR